MQTDRLDPGLQISQYAPQDLSDQLWESFFELREQRFRGLLPDDPLPSREFRKKYMLSPHPHWKTFWWMVFSTREQKFIGLGGLWFESQESPSYNVNKHIVYMDIYVDKDCRRQGIGTAYLKAILSQAKAHGKTLVRVESAEADSGVPFCQNLGGRVVTERHVNRLKIEKVDWSLMEKWQEGAQRAKGVSVELFQNVPEKDIDAYCKLYTQIMAQAPADDSAGQMIITPKKRRQDEKEYEKNGYAWHTMITREPDGAMSGLTEIFYAPEQPHLIDQELTGVKDAYRGRGLGKWLKADMLFFVKSQYPAARFVDTGNADHNAPMLSINERMGFEPLFSQTFFEFQAKDLAKTLGI